MIKNNKNGFTLVELLAVIVILAIILIIAVPKITDIIEGARQGAFESSEKMLVKATETYLSTSGVAMPENIDDEISIPYTMLRDSKYISKIYNPKNSSEECSGTIIVKKVAANKYTYTPNLSCGSIENPDYVSNWATLPPTITLVGDNPYIIEINKSYTVPEATAYDAADGTIDPSSITVVTPSIDNTVIGTYTVTYNVDDSDTNSATEVTRTVKVVSQGNVPELSNNMYPVKWNGTAWVVTTETDQEWYVYNGDIDNSADVDKNSGTGLFEADEWANAHITTTSLSVGDTVNESDLNMYVWIPRYSYLLNEGSKTIAIRYSDDTTDDNTSSYLSHPGFTFGSDELNGIWVAKFEMSSNTASDDFGVPSGAAYGVSRPSAKPWRNTSVNDMFNEARTIETEMSLTTADSHMMKSAEWSAAAYLSEAIRDGEEVWINNQGWYDSSSTTNNYKFITTGCAGTSVSVLDNNATSAGCSTNYDYKTGGVKASTTGNVYGIYDMSGGSWEYMATYINDNTDSRLTSSTYALALANADSKYKEMFNISGATDTTNYSNASVLTSGLSIHETSTSGTGTTSWHSDYSYFPYASYPVVLRGGYFDDSSTAGVFAFGRSPGGAALIFGWRAVLTL